MPKSVFDGAHRHFVDVFVAARQNSGLKQAELASMVGKDQTFISLIERGQRRVDVLEFIALARAMGQDPSMLFARVVAKMPDEFKI